jgi:hypothetical protein
VGLKSDLSILIQRGNFFHRAAGTQDEFHLKTEAETGVGLPHQGWATNAGSGKEGSSLELSGAAWHCQHPDFRL